MANQATINSLVPVVRTRLNLTNMNTITDAEIKTLLRSSCAQLYELICNRHRDYFIKFFKFPLIADQADYPLPADFRDNVQVWLLFGTGANMQRLPLEQTTWTKYQNQQPIVLLDPIWPTKYIIGSTSVFFTPTPGQTYPGAVEMLYVPQWKAPTTDDTTIGRELVNGWERWVEFDTCVQIAMRMRLGDYYAMYTRERDKIEGMIISAASIRDEQPQYMVDAFDLPFLATNVPGETT